MIIVWVLFGLGLWYVSGVASFVYWWTKDDDFTGDTLPTAMAVGIFGPVAFLMGLSIHGGNQVIISRRGAKENR